MGKIKKYSNLSLDERLQYWKDYLKGLIDFNLAHKNVPMKEELLLEIERVRKLIDVLEPAGIYETTIESRMNSGKEPLPKSTIPKTTMKLPRKSREDYRTIYRFRYDAALKTLVRDEDRPKKA